MFNARVQTIVPIVLLAVTLIVGTAGYIASGMAGYESFLTSLSLLVLNGPIEPSNPAIEFARWTGVIFALDIILSIIATSIATFSEDQVVRAKAKRPDAIAVHGDGVFAEKMVANLGQRAIHSDREAAFDAPCQVLLFADDAQAITFFNTNRDKLARARETYVGLNELSPSISEADGNTFFFSMADIAAELYWEDNPISEPQTVIIIGEGSYAESILTQALLVNIFSVENGMRYLVFGNFDRYRRLHTQLAKAVACNADVLEFPTDTWCEHLPEVKAAARVILCSNNDKNLSRATDLVKTGVQVPLHIRADSETSRSLFPADADITLFGTSEQLCRQAIVIQQVQHDSGKVCDASYRLGTEFCDGCKLQAELPRETAADASDDIQRGLIRFKRLGSVDFSKCVACPQHEAKWRGLSEFMKLSNYSVAAHDKQKLRLLASFGVTAESDRRFEDLPLEDRDYLQEVEHIRWERFHYLHGWDFAPGEKDPAARTHPYLVPYDQLERDIKDLDGDSYKTVLYRAGLKGRGLADSARDGSRDGGRDGGRPAPSTVGQEPEGRSER